MKNIGFFAILAIAIIAFSSCSPHVQLFETKNISPVSVEKTFYTFENDSVKIVYSFWANHGTLSFTVFNKLNIPLYIDWKKSSYVQNSQKLDYWVDMTTTKGVSKGHTRAFYGELYGNSYNSSTTIKPEQIVFIAPKSSISKDQFILFPETKANVGGAGNHVEEWQRTDKPGKTTTVQTIEFNETNSPLVYRNFLTISTSDKFDKEAYIDNGFYVSKISEMSLNNFNGGHENPTNSPFNKGSNFYIIPK